MVKRVFNFSAGPATLPLPALEEAQRDLLAQPGVGISVLEMSHRSKRFIEIMETAKANMARLLNLPANYKVLFLHGGARLQFSMIPMNFLRGTGKPANYIVTGHWGENAAKEAEREGTVRLAWNGKSLSYFRTPENSELTLDSDAAYVHFTSNETIEGVQFQADPETGAPPLVCDMSSDFLSRPINVSRYALIYAGAQKNVGPAGMAVVIIREDLLDRVPKGLHAMLDYRVHAENDSAYNTPPAFPIYFVTLTTRWLLETIGGLQKMEKLNREKAQLLYDAIDQSDGFYKGHAERKSRSMMNVTFRLPDAETEKAFLKEAETRELFELKGHRSVGGMRASIYNAMPREGCETLARFMEEFRKRKG